MQLCYWFQIMASEERQRSEPKERKTYGCQVCDHPYAYCASVKRHKQDIHSPKYYCNRCSFKTAHTKDLEKQCGKNGTSLTPNCMYLNTPVAAAVKMGRAPMQGQKETEEVARQTLTGTHRPIEEKRHPHHGRDVGSGSDGKNCLIWHVAEKGSDHVPHHQNMNPENQRYGCTSW